MRLAHGLGNCPTKEVLIRIAHKAVDPTEMKALLAHDGTSGPEPRAGHGLRRTKRP
jgi:hypothetical protein